MENRTDILRRIAFLHSKLELWSNGLTIDVHTQLQKIYDIHYQAFFESSEKGQKFFSERLINQVIAVVAKKENDQNELARLIPFWSAAFDKMNKNKVLRKKKQRMLFLIPFLAISLLAIVVYLKVRVIKDVWKPLDVHMEVPIQSERIYSFIPNDVISIDSIKLVGRDAWFLHQEEFDKTILLGADTLVIQDDLSGITYYSGNIASTHEVMLDVKSFEKHNRTIFSQRWNLSFDVHDESTVTAPGENSHEEELTLHKSFPVSSFQRYPHTKRTIRALQEEANLEHEYINKLKNWIIPFIALLLSLIFHLLFEGKRRESFTANQNVHPYYWKIELPERKKLSLPDNVEKQFHLLRQKLKTGRNRLNIPATIHKTIRGGGYVDFQFVEESVKSNYLFLINFQAQSDHKANLWKEIVQDFQSKDINANSFYFNGDVRLCFNEQFVNGLSLTELYNQYPTSTLVTIGFNYDFLNAETNKLNSWVRFFEQWTTRYLLTWKNFYNWDRREDELGEVFHVLPAIISSLPYLTLRPNASEKLNYKASFNDHLIDYQEKFDIGALGISFDEVQKDWISACMLYPTLHYDLSMEIGRIVYEHHDRELTLEEAESIFLLPWYSEGKFPEEIRKGFIGRIESKTELADKIRVYINKHLDQRTPPPESHAASLHKEAILLNEVLITSEPVGMIRKSEIRKELQNLYKNGVKPDLMSSGIIEGSILKKMEHGFVDSLGEPRRLWSLLSIVPFILLTSFLWECFVPDVRCEGEIGRMKIIEINRNLDPLLFNSKNQQLAIEEYNDSQDSIICTCNRTIPDDRLIFLENLNRQSIFLRDTSMYDTLEGEGEYVRMSRINEAVDWLNDAVSQLNDFPSTNVDSIGLSKELSTRTTAICNNIIFAHDLVYELGDDSEVHAFADSLKLALQWCRNFSEGLDSCRHIICENGGWCHNGKCKCPSGYMGERCNIRPSVSIVSFGYNDRKLKSLQTYFKRNNIKVLRTNILRKKPSYLADKTTVFYNPSLDDNMAAAEIARSFGEEIEKILGESMDIQQRTTSGAGSFIIHLVGDDSRLDPCETCVKNPIFVNVPADIKETLSGDLIGSSSLRPTKQITWAEPGVKSDCEILSISSNHNSGDAFPQGITEVIYTVIDVCGRKVSKSFTVQLELETKDMTEIDLPNEVLTVNGFVYNEAGEALIGATVEVEGKPIGTITDLDGSFRIRIEVTDRLVVGDIGYEKQSIKIVDQKPITVTLRPVGSDALSGTNAFKVEGVVYDKETSEALEGVFVSIIQTDKRGSSVITDRDGRFVLSSSINFNRIEFEFTSYENVTIQWNGEKSIRQYMVPANRRTKDKVVWVGDYPHPYAVFNGKSNRNESFPVTFELEYDVQLVNFNDPNFDNTDRYIGTILALGDAMYDLKVYDDLLKSEDVGRNGFKIVIYDSAKSIKRDRKSMERLGFSTIITLDELSDYLDIHLKGPPNGKY